MTTSTSFSLPLGPFVSRSLGVYLHNVVPFTLLGAVVLSPWIVLRLVADPGPDDLGLGLLALILQLLLGFALTGAVTYGVVQELRGTPAGFADTIAKGMQTFFSVLGTGFLSGLRIFLFSLLLLVPGIMEVCRLYVAIPAAVMERLDPGRAIDRSVRLTDGSRWAIFGAMVVVWLISMAVLMLLGLVVAMVADAGGMAIAALQIAFSIVTTTFGATLAAVCYFQLRQGKENVDVQQIASVFD